MADRKVTVWNNAGYQEILRTRVDDADPGDRLVVDGGGGTKFDTNIGFFTTAPREQYAAADQNLTEVIEQMRLALNAFGLTNITGDADYTGDLADLLDYIRNPIDLTEDAPIEISETDNNYTISLKDDFLIGTAPITASTQDADGNYTISLNDDFLAGVLLADLPLVITGPNADGEYTISINAATDTAIGAVELATIAETIAGTDATRAVTPDSLDGALNENGANVGTGADDGFTIDCGVYAS